MNFISKLDQLDKQLMLFLNYDGGQWTDTFWFNYSSKIAWIGVGAVILYLLIRNKGGWREALTVVLITALAIALADQISSSIIKPLVERPRPSRGEIAEWISLVNGYRGGRYGFVSSHAANSIAVVTWLSILFKGKLVRTLMFTWALGNCYSRIYLGVHYMGDIIGGILVGFFSAWVCIKLYRYIHKRLEARYNVPTTTSIYPSEPWLLSASLLLTVATLAIIACF